MTDPGAVMLAADKEQAFVSAIQLAQLAGALPSDIHYWARIGYLDRQKKGHSPYPLKQLPKAQLMALFTKRLQIKAEKASALADDLLRLYEDRPDAFPATIGMVQVLESRMTEFVSLLLDFGLLPRIGELLKKDA